MWWDSRRGLSGSAPARTCRARAALPRGAHAHERESLYAVVIDRLAYVHVALRVDRERVRNHDLPTHPAAAAERTEHSEIISPHDPNLFVRPIGHVQEALIRRQAEAVHRAESFRVCADEPLF